MTQLLISVTDVQEAQLALENGANIIDLKDPRQGALGALPIPVITEVVAYVAAHQQAQRILTSATIGDLPMEPALIAAQVAALVETKVDIIKIGFFDAEDYQPCLDALAPFANRGVKLVAVLFAEHHYASALITAIKQAGFFGIMLDTMRKNGKNFLDYFLEADIKTLSKKVQNHNMLFGLAGSLSLQHIALLKKINPSYIGFRGGVCDAGQRQLGLDPTKISAISKLL